MKHYFTFFLLLIGAVAIQSCNDDDTPALKVGALHIKDAEYTGTALKVLYSKDNGSTYSETLSNFKAGDKILVKLNNGTEDLTSENFTFDWSDTWPAPTSKTSDVAEITAVGSNLAIIVKVSDIWSLVTSNRTSGKFYTLDKTTGDATEAFTPTYNSATLNEIRAFTYHPKKRLYYASVNSYVDQDGVQAGFLYTVDPSTKVATRINNNDGNDGAYDIWDAVVNWAVAADDSLIAIGDFNSDGNGIVKFGTDGGRSLKTAQADICCGLGMLYDASTSTFTFGNGENTGDEEIAIETMNAAGDITNTKTITTFTGFPTDMSSNWLNLKAMAKDRDGSIYGIMFIYETKKSAFVKIDLTKSEITFIKMLGDNATNQYNNLTFIPKYLL